MNYYEELGIDPSATEEEIGRAHRRLARLMHPDQQVDEAVKKLAETQMRRLNGIVEVLTNPEKRHLYDEQLQGKGGALVSGASTQVVAKTTNLGALEPTSSLVLGLRRIWRALPWWVWSTAGALVMTLAISWMVADYTGSSFENRPTDYVRPKDEPEHKDHKPPEPDRSAATPAASEHTGLAALNRILAAMEAAKPMPAAPAPDKNPEVKKEDNEKKNEDIEKATAAAESGLATAPGVSAPETERAKLPETKAANPHAPEIAEVAKTALVPSTSKPPELKIAPVPAKPGPAELKAAPAPSGSHAAESPIPLDVGTQGKTAATAVATPVVPAIVKPDPQNWLAGDWVYAPVEPETPAKGYFPPEFIELRLVSEQGLLHGEYRARYRVTNAPVRADVNFQVIATGSNSKKFSWQSSDGSKGVLKITQIDAQNIEVEWKRTTKSQEQELNVGSATLTRRNVE